MCAVQNLSGNSVAICLIQHTKSESKLLENCIYVCMSLQHWLCFHTLAKLVTPHMKFHSMLHALSCCLYMQCLWQPDHKKHNIRYFPITTIKTSHKHNNNSHTKLPQYQQHKINILQNNLTLLSLTLNHSYDCSRTLLYKTFTLSTIHYIAK